MTAHSYINMLTKHITPRFRYDLSEDFNCWQIRARTKLKELLGLPLIKPENDKFNITEQAFDSDMEYKYFSFQSEDEYNVRCCLVRSVKSLNPRDKLPLAICLQGHSTGMHISLGKSIFEGDDSSIKGGRDFAIRAAKEGMVAIAIEQRYMGKSGSNEGEPSCVPSHAFASSNEAMAALLIGRTAIGERVWDISRTLDIAQKYFDDIIDFNNVICLGNSGGGTAALYASCIDERITFSVPSCSVCTFDDSIMAMNHCPCNFVPHIRNYFDMGDLCSLIAPRKLLVVCGSEDKIFPLEGVRQSFDVAKNVYQHIKKPGNIRLVIGNGGHRFYPDESWPVIHMLLNDKSGKFDL